MQDRVPRTLFGFLCEGELSALGDVENHSGKNRRRNFKVSREDWQLLSETEFFGACRGRWRVLQLPGTQRDPLFLVNVRIETSALDACLFRISQSPKLSESAGDTRQFGAAADTTISEMVHRTGLAGKPTSWHLIETECRRRYAEGERHPGKIGESPTEWARVLIKWFKLEHPRAAPVTEKALTNRLSPLLRELRSG
jgi:hypothetical protein